ncbi:B-cell scaffold protein with ankyrin repeats isoform X2 [Mixophyes fleayi]|uniref:B-cell scaffold protein with ankyrin repeats isoform X2 n=1 Tax=Mixophyes fleayi TaxID=3061075 RepID=UPI003F4E0DF6
MAAEELRSIRTEPFDAEEKEIAKDLLVIYEKSGEEWATYLKRLLSSNLHIHEIILYDLDSNSNEMLKTLTQSKYHCKLLVLTSYLLKIFYENQCKLFSQLLEPSHRVVLLLCGVESPEELYELSPLERNFQVILTDQDPQDYISVVSAVMNEDYQDTNICPKLYTTEDLIWDSSGHEDITTVQIPSASVLPKRISCENPGQLFIILPDEMPNNSDIEVKFSTENQIIRRKAMRCNQKIICLTALDFPPGPVTVNVCCVDVIIATAQIEYFSAVEDLKLRLSKIVDPITFFCQAFNIYTLEELDKVLMKSLQNKITPCEFNRHEINQHTIHTSSEEIPTLLHCAAKLGLKEVTLSLMHSPAADYICKITNKYGEDPATIAEKHGHLDIQDIIHQLAEKANQTDIPREVVEREHEDVYVDMDQRADQQSTKDSRGNEHEANVDPINESELDAHEYPVMNRKEESGEKDSENTVSEWISDVIDDYCFLEPTDNPSEPFTNDNLPYILQASGEVYKTDIDEEWYCAATGKYSSEDEKSWQEQKYEHCSESLNKNIYVPLPVHSTTGDLPAPEYQNLPAQLACPQEEEINYGKMSCDALVEYPEKGLDSEYDEEPVTITFTEDDVYIIFESSTKTLTAHNPSAPETTSNPTIESGASYITQEERKDNDNENVLYDDLDYHPDRGYDNEYDEEQLVTASTEDNVYIVFENSIKNKQKGQKSFIDHNLAASETTSRSTIDYGASYTAQAEGRDESIEDHYFWSEPVDEDTEEDPYSLAYADDDLYMELPLETADEEHVRGRKSFIVHRAPAPAPRPQQQAGTDIEDSYITRVFRQKEKEKNIYGTGLYQDKVHMAKPEAYVPPQQCVASGQDELILLQEKVKLGIISVDEALQKFQQWQNEKSGLDLLQQKKLQQLRDNIIGDKPDDDKVYDKITIVHQPNAFPAKHRGTGMFDSSIYQKPYNPAHSSTQYPIKRDNGTSGKLPYAK